MANVFELEGSLSFDSSGFYNAVKSAIEAGEKLKLELERTDKAMDSMDKALADTDKALQKVESSTKDFTKETKETSSATSDLDKSMDSLSDSYGKSEKEVEDLKKELERVRKESGNNAEETKKLSERLEEAQKESDDLRKQVKELEDRYKSAQDETKDLDDKTSKLSNAFEGAGDKIRKFADFMKNGFVTGIKVGVAGLATASAAVAGVVKGIADTAELGDNIDKMSQKLGMSAQAYQEWDFIMQHSGSSIEAMQGGMKTLASLAETNAEMFEMVGLSQQEVANMSQEELFGATITALQNVTDETQRTYLASKLLGRGGNDLGALLNTSSEEVEAMRQQVHELGGVMSDTAVKDAAQFQDSLQDMKTAFTGVKNGIFGDLMPTLSTAMQGIAGIFSGNQEEGLEKLSSGIESFVTGLSDKLPKVIETGSNIISALAEGIAGKLPDLLATVTGALSSAITSILSSITDVKVIKQVTESAKTLFGGLITGAKDVIIGLTDALPSFLLTIGNVLRGDNGIIKQLGSALKEAVPVVLDNLEDVAEVIFDVFPDIISDIGGVITDLLPDLFPKILETIWTITDMLANSDLFASIADLIIPLMEALLEAAENAYPIVFELIPKVVSDLIDTIGRYFDENSDSITEHLESFMEHLIDFIIDYTPALLGAIKDIIVALVGGLIDNLPLIYKPFSDMFEDFGGWLYDISEKVSSWGEERLQDLKGLVASILDGVTSFKRKVGEKIGEIVSSIKDKITDMIKTAKTWGKDLIDNFVGGITDKISKVKDAIGSVAGVIGDYIHFSEPDKGALANFHTFAPDMMELFAQGIRDNADLVYNQVKALTNGISSSFAVEASTVSADTKATSGITINNYLTVENPRISSDTDLEELSDSLLERINEGLAGLDIFAQRAYGGVTI